MWLLDVNVDTKLTEVLHEYGVMARSTIDLGWRHLANGELAATAIKAASTPEPNQTPWQAPPQMICL